MCWDNAGRNASARNNLGVVLVLGSHRSSLSVMLEMQLQNHALFPKVIAAAGGSCTRTKARLEVAYVS
jgi:hypothetical protein